MAFALQWPWDMDMGITNMQMNAYRDEIVFFEISSSATPVTGCSSNHTATWC